MILETKFGDDPLGSSSKKKTKAERKTKKFRNV